MLNMNIALAKTFQWPRIKIINAFTGEIIQEYDGMKESDLFVLGHEWNGHRVFSINPRVELIDGKHITSLAIWLNPDN